MAISPRFFFAMQETRLLHAAGRSVCSSHGTSFFRSCSRKEGEYGADGGHTRTRLAGRVFAGARRRRHRLELGHARAGEAEHTPNTL